MALCIAETFIAAFLLREKRVKAPKSEALRGERAAPTIDLISVYQALTVTEQLSFRKAAAVLGIRQSAVSRRVRLLEDNLGVSLFERRPRGVQVTLAGSCFFERVRPALEQLDFAVTGAKAAGQGKQGRLRIGIFTPPTGGFLRSLIASFSQNYPDVTLDFSEGSRLTHFAGLRAQTLDVAFVTGASPVPDCETVELWSERIHIALPVDHPLCDRDQLDWPDIRGERFIVSRFAPGPEVRDYVVRRVASFSSYPTIEQVAVSPATIIHLVGMGFGLGVVAASWTALGIPGVAFRPLIDPADILPFSAVWSPGNDNPALRRFLSVAHIMAGHMRRGTSDWASKS